MDQQETKRELITVKSDVVMPSFNRLAGLRYFVTDRIAVFREYKYNSVRNCQSQLSACPTAMFALKRQG
jgi:hypothetical protein